MVGTMPDPEKVINALEWCIDKPCMPHCPYFNAYDESQAYCLFRKILPDALALLKTQEPRVIPLSELLTFDAKWQFNTPPYLCTEEIDTKRMWWRSWRDIYLSIRCEGTMGSNNYGTEWRCWTFHPTEEQRKAAKWDESTEV